MPNIILIIISLIVAGFHILWGIESRGTRKVIPEDDDFRPIFSPTPFACFLMAFAFIILALFSLAKYVNFPLPHLVDAYGTYAVAIVFFLRAIGDFNYMGIFKKKYKSEFAHHDTYFFTPLCIIVGILCLFI